MILLRSIIFTLVFYLWSASVALLALPFLWFAPRSWAIAVMRFWGYTLSGLLAAICGIRVEIRGLQHLPRGPALIAAKHHCMLDTMAPLTAFSDVAFVMKKELMHIPVYGWYARKSGMIVVDRDANAKALRRLVIEARACLAEGRQVVIFPEGHRNPPGVKGDYKPGVAAIYRDLGVPCIPMATNSGVHWPAHGFLRKPGVIVYEFLEPIPVGLPRAEFMRTLETRLEAASSALLTL